MEIQCPSCKKLNVDASSCVRCGCDLQPLQNILQAALHEIAAGRNKLRVGKFQEAFSHAARSWRLKNSADAARLAFLAQAGERRFEEALVWYCHAIRNEKPSAAKL